MVELWVNQSKFLVLRIDFVNTALLDVKMRYNVSNTLFSFMQWKLFLWMETDAQ